MQQQQIKIHTLGPKRLSSTARKSPNKTAQNVFGINKTIKNNNNQIVDNSNSKNIIIQKNIDQVNNRSNSVKRTAVTFNKTYANIALKLPQNKCTQNVNLQLTRKVSMALVNKPLIITAPTPLHLIKTPIIKYVYVQNQQFQKLSLQLSELRIKYDELMKKLLQNQQNQSQQDQKMIKQNMEKVIESTRQIQMKISKIQLRQQQNNNEVFFEMNKIKQNKCKLQMNQTASSQFNTQLPLQKQKIQQQCLQIIQTVNMATQKIEQLQQKTQLLQKQVNEQKQCKQALQKQNKRLRKMLEDKQNQKYSQVQTLKFQLTKLKEKQLQVQQLSLLKPVINNEMNMKKSQKLLQIGQVDMNSHIYLLDQLNSSRFSVNNSRIGQSRIGQSRVSQVYQ